MDKCFGNKFVTVAERCFVLVHAGSVGVHSTAMVERSCGRRICQKLGSTSDCHSVAVCLVSVCLYFKSHHPNNLISTSAELQEQGITWHDYSGRLQACSDM